LSDTFPPIAASGNQLSNKVPTILIAGPLPPPYGGVASIVALLTNESFGEARIHLVETTIRTNRPFARMGRGVGTFLRLLTALLRYRPDGLLCFCGAYGSFWEKGMWAALARLLNVPAAVVMVDGNFPAFEKRLGSVRRWAMRLILRTWSRICVQSKAWQTYYQSLAGHDRFSIIVGGVNQATFAPAGRSGLSAAADKLTILYVGWLIEEKGIYDLLEAAALLKQTGVRFQLRFIGPLFDQEPRLRQALADADLKNEVALVGPLAQAEALVAEYQSANVFVLPSHAEGFPNVVLESMACGLPVIATSVGGVPEIIDSGRNGILVMPKDIPQLASALTELITDAEARLRLGEAARAAVLDRFTINHSLASYMNVFRQLTAPADDQVVRASKRVTN
jgi:glycosyltransferase involved in cell wall biosynthesis